MVVFVTMNRKRQATSELDAIPQPKKLKQDETGCPVAAKNIVCPSKFGIMGPIRRVASLNAELAVHLLLSDSPPPSPMGAGLTNNGHVKSNSSNHVTARHVNSLPKSLQNGHDSIPLPLLTSHTGSVVGQSRKLSDSSIESVMTPLSSLSSDYEERAVRSPQPKLKEPVISLVDCKKMVKSETAKNPVKSETAKNPVKSETAKNPMKSETTKNPPMKSETTKDIVKKVRPRPFTAVPPFVDSGGYVKRMASLNARARVTALIEPQRRVMKTSQSNLHPLVKKTLKSLPPPTVQQEVKDKVSLPCGECIKVKVDAVQPNGRSVASGVTHKLPATSMETEEKNIDDKLDTTSYSSVGLLYNGDTIHPSARFLLTNERTLPKPMLPIVVPVCGLTLGETIVRARMQHKRKSSKPKAHESDNGWTPIGNPIKKAEYMKGNTRVLRKYYAAIRRKDEEVYVRDCVVIKSGRKKQDKPYVAKITSLWEESEGIMMTVFWYYRPEDANGAVVTDFQECELLGSQHHDENSVACIEDKCYVLGLRQYYRYLAMVKRTECGLEAKHPIVPGHPKFGIVGSEDKLPLENVDPSLVFLCCHGYNHFAGRICK